MAKLIEAKDLNIALYLQENPPYRVYLFSVSANERFLGLRGDPLPKWKDRDLIVANCRLEPNDFEELWETLLNSRLEDLKEDYKDAGGDAEKVDWNYWKN